MIRVLVWNEFFHEREEGKDNVKANYPDGIHNYIKNFLDDEFEVKTATLDDENCGITKEVLDNTDVLIWWAHCKHQDVPDEVAKLVQDAVLRGMGVVFLHSAHLSKPFTALMGTTCRLHWRCEGEKERLWTVDPSHPIAQGIDPYVTIPHEEMYGEPFGIPEPDKLVFIGSFAGGEVFRSGCCWRRQLGKVFYFQPGHEDYPVYHEPQVQQIIKNAVNWCYSSYRVDEIPCPKVDRPKD